MKPDTSASQVIQQHSRSFSLALRFMPARLRAPISALYAWCRSVDDAVDRISDPQLAKQTLNLLDDDLQRSTRGQAVQHAASAWIQPLLAEHRIEVRHARELIEGMRMDLQRPRLETDTDLRRYCYHAAGTVGLMMTRLMGVTDSRADRHAEALGIAMQLTNIARDVLEDARLGRSYLPGVPCPLSDDPGRVKAVVKHVLNIAEHYYGVAEKGLSYLPRDCRLGIQLALAFYREIGREIRRQDYAVLQQRTTVSKWRLFVVSVSTCFAWLTQETQIAVTELRSSFTYLLKEWTMHDNRKPQVPSQSINNSQVSTPGQAKQTVYLGLSLTLIMATALFTMVFVHPKSVEYSVNPLIYAALCLCGSLIFHRLSRWADPLRS